MVDVSHPRPGGRFDGPRGAGAVDLLLQRWSESFDGLVAKWEPAVSWGPCGERTTIYGLAEARSGDPNAPAQCRVCVIAGGMRVFAAHMARADARSGRTQPPLAGEV